MLFRFDHEGSSIFVQATDHTAALDLWRCSRERAWKADDSWYGRDESDKHPTTIEVVSTSEPLRHNPIWATVSRQILGADHLLSVRFREALHAIVDEPVPENFDPSDESCFDAIQSWCVNHAVPEWSTGIGVYEAAEHIVGEAISNGNLKSNGEIA